jgi:hypothetical protein
VTSGEGLLTRGVAGWWVWVCVGGGGVCSVCWAVGGCVCGSWWWLCLDVFLSGLAAGECSGMVFRAAALVVVWLAGSAGWFWDRGFVVSGLVW